MFKYSFKYLFQWSWKSFKGSFPIEFKLEQKLWKYKINITYIKLNINFSKKITSRKSWWTSALRVRIRAFYEFHFKLNWWVHMTITTVEFICYSYLWNSSLTIRETMLAQLWPMIFIIESFHMINYISTKISWIEFGHAFNKTPSFEISSNLSLTYRESKNKRRKTSYWLCD